MTRFELVIFLKGGSIVDVLEVIMKYYDKFRSQYNVPPAGRLSQSLLADETLISPSEKGVVKSEVVTFSGWANNASSVKFLLTPLVEKLRVKGFDVHFFCEQFETEDERIRRVRMEGNMTGRAGFSF